MTPQTENLRAFLQDLMDPEMYGWAVPAEVRQRAGTLLILLQAEASQMGNDPVPNGSHPYTAFARLLK